jgi:hypothetical protein
VARKLVKASTLRKGEHLKTDDGTSATADGGHTPASHDGWMWDLTVQDDHDFYVVPPTAVTVSTMWTKAASRRFSSTTSAPMSAW